MVFSRHVRKGVLLLTKPGEKKPSCVFVIGPESSGSTYIARLISRALERGNWSGRGFNCCSEAMCDVESGHVLPCSPVEEGRLVCHRSLPFGRNEYPPIAAWQATYEAKWVICVRDQTISELSRQHRFLKTAALCTEQSAAARLLCADLLASNTATYVWSYEGFMFLGDAYLQHLFRFLCIQMPAAADLQDEELVARDGNLKYVLPPTEKKITKMVRRFEVFYRRKLRAS
jgi:hypothetical protein